ncbi:hypothetical protein TD95_002064 [Thielaviopsis punctulata]|uniref:Rhodopsin domain-containing protein n=1 Tax=Thielaviopsis punctulata TaxID=72032 RepID=A0A0F4ZGK4_9PEZI|nr:hypothetical protein TD95_002064 [Thielaviopsis punctulata]
MTLETELSSLDPAHRAAILNEYNAQPLVSVTIAFLTMSWICILLRTYVRVFLTRNFLADDWFMVSAQLVYTASAVLMFLSIHWGLGRHNAALPINKMTNALMYQALVTETYVLNMMLLKFSIGIFLLRLATRKVYTYIIWASLIVVAIWSIVIFMWNILQCDPIRGQWDITIPNRKCVTTSQILAAAYSISVMTIVTDWLYAIIPIPMLWGVKMNVQTKATVIIILGLGVFASIATLIRFKYLVTINDHTDILYSSTDAFIWTMVEPAVATIASCLSTIRPLLRQFRIKGFESTESASYAVNGRNGARSNPNRSNLYSEIGLADIELGDKNTVTTTTVMGATGNRSPSSSQTEIVSSVDPPLSYGTEKGSASVDSAPEYLSGNKILHTTRIIIQSEPCEEFQRKNSVSKYSPTGPRATDIIPATPGSSRQKQKSSADSLDNTGPYPDTSPTAANKTWMAAESGGDDRSLEDPGVRPQQNSGPLGSNPPAMF